MSCGGCGAIRVRARSCPFAHGDACQIMAVPCLRVAIPCFHAVTLACTLGVAARTRRSIRVCVTTPLVHGGFMPRDAARLRAALLSCRRVPPSQDQSPALWADLLNS